MSASGSKRKYIFVALAVILLAGGWTALNFYEKSQREFNGTEPVWIMIPPGSSEDAIRDSLSFNFGRLYGENVFDIWGLLKGNVTKAHGAYRILPGDKAIDIARRIKTGSQTPIRITFNNVRKFDELLPKIAEYFNFTTRELEDACDSILPLRGYDKNNFIGAFLPDSYEFYWTANPVKVVTRLIDYHDNFWNAERKAKAESLGLSPEQVTILASIVDEETAVNDEKPTIGRLYLNRLNRGMKLQADPTVKYAVGDFTLRRILNSHLAYQSPYNTYMVEGLPPGPIRMPEKNTIDAVLNAPSNNYLYMCAKEDFSGRHNFSTTLEGHNANAARYREALNRRGIK